MAQARVRPSFCVPAGRWWLVGIFLPAMLLSAPLAAQTAEQVRAAASQTARALDLQTELPGEAERPELDKPFTLDLSLFQVFLWAAIICGLAALAFAFRDVLPGGGLARRSAWADASGSLGIGAGRSDAETEFAANLLAQQGRFGEAMHVLLLQALAEMRKRLDLRFAASLTSREILHDARVSAHSQTALGDLIDKVEWTYFGEHPAGPDDYLACRDRFEAFCRALRDEVT